MDLHLIENIVCIADEKSITRAAEKRFVTQSALNQQLQKLEEPLNEAVDKFNNSKNNILKALVNAKEEKKRKGIFGSLWGSNQPVLNENNQQ